MDPLSDIEYEILGAIYFVEPFDKILEECKGTSEAIVADSLKSLIHRKLVTVMKYSEDKRDYEKSFIYDSDDMRAYQYLITKDGLLTHNQR